MMFWLSLLQLLIGYCIGAKYEPHLLITEPSDQLEPRISKGVTFPQVVFTSNVMVDKSLLIKDLIEDDGNVYLIACPSRWGKSINMLMLKSFFEIQLDKNNKKIVPISSTPNYGLFVNGEFPESEGKKLQSAFLIARHKAIIDNHLGQYPVIHVDFATSRLNNTDMKNFIASRVAVAFQQHSYASSLYKDVMEDTKNDDNIKEEARQRYKQFKKYQNSDTIDQLTANEVIQSLNFLSETLKIYHNKTVVLLMDEYFIPWERILDDEFQSDVQIKDFLDFYSNFMAASFGTNTHLEKGIITGVLPPFNELALSLPDIIECNLLNGKFMEYYSFNQWDVAELLNHVNASKVLRQELDRYYTGYAPNNRNFIIYNAVSIIEFLTTKEVQPAWISRGDVGYIMRNFLKTESFKKKLASLKSGKSVVVKVFSHHLSWAEYELLFNAKYYWATDADEDLIQKLFMLLHAAGYLTLARNADLKSNIFYMKFPNKEIISSIQSVDFEFTDAPEEF